MVINAPTMFAELRAGAHLVHIFGGAFLKPKIRCGFVNCQTWWTCPQLIPHPVLNHADNRSNLTGDVPPIAECLRQVL